MLSFTPCSRQNSSCGKRLLSYSLSNLDQSSPLRRAFVRFMPFSVNSNRKTFATQSRKAERRRLESAYDIALRIRLLSGSAPDPCVFCAFLWVRAGGRATSRPSERWHGRALVMQNSLRRKSKVLPVSKDIELPPGMFWPGGRLGAPCEVDINEFNGGY